MVPLFWYVVVDDDDDDYRLFRKVRDRFDALAETNVVLSKLSLLTSGLKIVCCRFSMLHQSFCKI